jgi:hypothetical protein
MGDTWLPFRDPRAQWYQCSYAVLLSRIYWERRHTLAVWRLERVQFVPTIKFVPMQKRVVEKTRKPLVRNTVRHREERYGNAHQRGH